jgi:hypothetical protein
MEKTWTADNINTSLDFEFIHRKNELLKATLFLMLVIIGTGVSVMVTKNYIDNSLKEKKPPQWMAFSENYLLTKTLKSDHLDLTRIK